MSSSAYWAAHAAARREDLWWMATTGETSTGAARRLNITLTNLEKWCRVHDVELWHRLRANDPRPLFSNNDQGHNQWSEREDMAS